MSLPLIALLALRAEKPTATVKLDAKAAAVGQPVKGVLTLVFPQGQHGYQNPPADKFENPITLKVIEAGFKLDKVAYPKGVELKLDGMEKPTKIYEGTIQIPFTLRTTKTLPKGGKVWNVNFQVDYQLCTMTSCFPPSSLVVKAPLQVTAAPKKVAKKP